MVSPPYIVHVGLGSVVEDEPCELLNGIRSPIQVCTVHNNNMYFVHAILASFPNLVVCVIGSGGVTENMSHIIYTYIHKVYRTLCGHS